jgi:uncharacterized protein YfiM (DUF2279 family)
MQTVLAVLVLAQLAALEPTGGRTHPVRDASVCAAHECMAAQGRMTVDQAGAAHANGPRRIAGLEASRVPHHRIRQSAQDEWFAVDKVQHFAMAYGTAMLGYGVLRGAGVSHNEAQTAALAGSLAAGIGKELFDRARGGPFSVKDLTWDALGTLAAWGLLSLNR